MRPAQARNCPNITPTGVVNAQAPHPRIRPAQARERSKRRARTSAELPASKAGRSRTRSMGPGAKPTKPELTMYKKVGLRDRNGGRERDRERERWKREPEEFGMGRGW